MPPPSVQSLVERIRRWKLLEKAQFTHLVHDLQHRFPDPQALARQLVERNWLTAYQAEELLKGQGNGLILGQYRLLDRLGEGGMGQVYKARHQTLGRLVALKVIRKDLLLHPDAVRRFRREIRAASKLAHPNVILALDADEVKGVHFFAMEFAGGPDLLQVVRRRGPLPVDLACEYIRQGAIGLQHAHERGLVHRDVKPSNLLVTTLSGSARPLVKVLDLGLARLAVSNDDLTPLSQSGVVIGTPDYMAPEQAMAASHVDHRADIYSLGCTLYYLLTSQVPFPAASNIEKLLCHQTDEPTPVRQLRPDVPRGLEEVLRRLMAKRPEDRYQTAALAANALAPFCPSWPGEPSTLGVALPGVPLPSPGYRRRNPLLRAVLLTGLVVVGGAGGVWAWYISSHAQSPAAPTVSQAAPTLPTKKTTPTVPKKPTASSKSEK